MRSEDVAQLLDRAAACSSELDVIFAVLCEERNRYAAMSGDAHPLAKSVRDGVLPGLVQAKLGFDRSVAGLRVLFEAYALDEMQLEEGR